MTTIISAHERRIRQAKEQSDRIAKENSDRIAKNKEIEEQLSKVFSDSNEFMKKLTESVKDFKRGATQDSGVLYPSHINLYTSVDVLLATVVKEAYEKDRVAQITFGERVFTYMPEKSAGMWAHYESDLNVLVGLHGATIDEYHLIALNEALGLTKEEVVFEEFCVKYEELLKESKRVIVAGHSIGGLAVQKCWERHVRKLPAITFAAYTPRLNTGWAQNIVRKWVFRNDWLSSNQLKIDNPVNLHPITPTSTISFFNGHGMANYLDKDLVNNGI